MIDKLVKMYSSGAITADHLVADCLHMVDPENPALVLSHLPGKILLRMHEYTDLYQNGRMLSNYRILPAADQVAAARKWIESERSGWLASGESAH